MPANHFNSHCPDWAEALLNGFSQIFLQRHPLCGLLCLLAILLTAPVLFAGALLGGVAGLLTAQRHHPWLPLLGIVLALLLTPLFAAVGLATLTAPFILACWLIRAGIQMLGAASVDSEPCAHGGNQPRLR